MTKFLIALIASCCFFTLTKAADANSFDGTWTGTYQCGPGLTNAEITITSQGMSVGRFSGTFRFFAHPSNPNLQEAKFGFVAKVSQDGRSFRAEPSHWIQRPQGYVFAPFEGRLSEDGENVEGRVDYPGCGDLTIAKAADTPENNVLTFLSPDSGEKSVAESCWQMDMTDAIAIYDCLTLRHPTSSLSGKKPTGSCNAFMSEVSYMVREAYKARGINQIPRVYIKSSRETAEHPLPSCEVVAEVMYEMFGEEPIWTPCLGYDPENKKKHFRDCTIAYLVGKQGMTAQAAAQRARSMGCDQLKSLYYQRAMQLAYKEIDMPNGQIWKLPENIQDIDCLEVAEIVF